MSRLMARFMALVSKLPDEPGCWLWTGYYTGGQYGGFYVAGKMLRAHRFSYEALVGPIPDGLVLDHICRMRLCVNPSHLRVVTQFENTMIGEGVTARNARKTHCSKGHEFTPENTRLTSRAEGRVCLTCKSAYNIAYCRAWRRRALEEGR